MNVYRATARIVGVIYLAGFVVGIWGNVLIQSVLSTPNYLTIGSANSMKIAFGSILWLLAVVGDVAHGILMFPILKHYNERIAIGYLASRIVDAIFIAVMVLFTLLQIPLGSEYLKAAIAEAHHLQALSTVFMQASKYAYYIAMSNLGIAGMMLCYAFYRTKLIPRWIAFWGLIGYAVIFLGMLSEVLGSGLELASSIPGGLWEVFIGVWLLVKGFNSSAITLRSAETENG